MKVSANNGYILSLLLIIGGSLILASCATSPPACNSPQSKNLDAAIDSVKSNLNSGLPRMPCRSPRERVRLPGITHRRGNSRHCPD